MGRWAAVIGSPITHSLSPVLHRAAYSLLGLDWAFRTADVDVAALPAYVGALDSDCVGLAVTMPNKQAILPLLDSVDGLAKAVGAANTCVISGGLTAGFNTDVHGIVETIRDASEGRPLRAGEGKRALLLGTKATASSALAAATTLGYQQVTVVGRDFSGQGNILLAAGRLGVSFDPLLWKHRAQVTKACRDADLVISTIPPAATADLAHSLEVRPEQTLLDVTYANGVTPLSGAFSSAGATVLSPLSMLTYQGLAQVKLWSGLEAPFKPVYRAVREAAAGVH